MAERKINATLNLLKANMILKRELKYNGYLKIEQLTIKTPEGKEIKREVLLKKNAVAALVYNTSSGKYIFARQFRPGPENDILEIPAGVLDIPGESDERCLAREVEEEVGYRIDRLQFITEGYVSPGGTTEMISIYFAEVSQKTGSGGGLATEDEEIEIVELTRAEMLAFSFKDFKTIIAVMWTRHNHHLQ
jgi:ADP-ribose pyrophosphatase